MNHFADRILHFYQTLDPSFELPRGIEIMHPYREEASKATTSAFYQKFYSDNNARIYLIGINPGRFGGGITGIPFTDPVNLSISCGIEHSFPMKAELSSGFIYKMIEKCGGAQSFFSKYFLTAVSPLGFTLNGKNLNYYDDKVLYSSARPFILETIAKQVKAGAERKLAFCLGEGVNYQYLSRLNDELKLFRKIIPLPHPRWIMQYRRKKMDEYIALYQQKLGQ
jgi:hypothetical protein